MRSRSDAVLLHSSIFWLNDRLSGRPHVAAEFRDPGHRQNGPDRHGARLLYHVEHFLFLHRDVGSGEFKTLVLGVLPWHGVWDADEGPGKSLGAPSGDRLVPSADPTLEDRTPRPS